MEIVHVKDLYEFKETIEGMIETMATKVFLPKTCIIFQNKTKYIFGNDGIGCDTTLLSLNRVLKRLRGKESRGFKQANDNPWHTTPRSRVNKAKPLTQKQIIKNYADDVDTQQQLLALI